MTPGANDVELDDPITRHMRTDYALLRMGDTVEESLLSIRARPPEGRVIYFYVVDEEQRLCGVVPTRRLLLSPPEAIIADIMVKSVIALPIDATVLDACEFFTLHRLLAFPVIDDKRRMVGLVDVELYAGELSDLERSERNDDLFQLIGVRLVEARQSSLLAGFRSRFPWLLTNIAGGIAAAFISGMFEAELENVVLALFIPVVLALAESVSIQSVSLALQVLHGRQPTWPDLFGRLRGEVVTGILLGLACAVIVSLVAWLWRGDGRVALSLLGGISGSVACAAIIGVAMPYLLRMMQREPQVAAGPIALASADMVTLLIYFSLARWLLKLG
jgi:magnesium transporter